jgi:hypothetical protein
MRLICLSRAMAEFRDGCASCHTGRHGPFLCVNLHVPGRLHCAPRFGDPGRRWNQCRTCLPGFPECRPRIGCSRFPGSPRRSQLEPGLIERGTFRLERLYRKGRFCSLPWNGSSNAEAGAPVTPKEPREPLKLARYYQSLLDSGQFRNRAALARSLGVSRARVTQVLNRLSVTRMREHRGAVADFRRMKTSG